MFARSGRRQIELKRKIRIVDVHAVRFSSLLLILLLLLLFQLNQTAIFSEQTRSRNTLLTEIVSANNEIAFALHEHQTVRSTANNNVVFKRAAALMLQEQVGRAVVFEVVVVANKRIAIGIEDEAAIDAQIIFDQIVVVEKRTRKGFDSDTAHTVQLDFIVCECEQGTRKRHGQR